MVSRFGLMVALLAGVALWLAGTPWAHARLGETLAQLKTRFGEPQTVKAVQTPVAKEYVFQGKDGVQVSAFCRGTVCEKITYNRVFGGLKDEEIQQLLKINGPIWIEEKTPQWEIVKNRNAGRMWRREDSQAWAETGKISRYLCIMTFDWLNAEAKATAEAEAQQAREAAKPQKLNGF